MLIMLCFLNLHLCHKSRFKKKQFESFEVRLSRRVDLLLSIFKFKFVSGGSMFVSHDYKQRLLKIL